MTLPPAINRILKHYSSDSPGTRANLVRLLQQGVLKNTGHLVIYPVDQGFEHGPWVSFSKNIEAYAPSYHVKLAIKAGLSALAAPVGFLESVAHDYAGLIPFILKLNSGSALQPTGEMSNQAITSSVETALRLGCSGIGYTIYPGADQAYTMYESLQYVIERAKEAGLFVVVWSYPRGHISKSGETSLDVVSYGAHMACLMGAHIIKVKLPSSHLERVPASDASDDFESLDARISHVVRSCFNGERMVLFSGGEMTDDARILEEIKAIRQGGATGSIIGRNCFQRKEEDALALLKRITSLYKES